MKKYTGVLLVFILLIFFNDVSAQNKSIAIAQFPGNQASLDTAVRTNHVSFAIKNIDDGFKGNFENKARMYVPVIVLLPAETIEKNVQWYTVVFQNNKPEMKMLNRLFIAAGIRQIEFDGATISREDFFLPYME
jgi:hypothetical protein